MTLLKHESGIINTIEQEAFSGDWGWNLHSRSRMDEKYKIEDRRIDPTVVQGPKSIGKTQFHYGINWGNFQIDRAQ